MSKISLRWKPCKCGCQGQDSQHKKVIERKISNLRENRTEAVLGKDGREPVTCRMAGEIRVPWQQEPVLVREWIGTLESGKELSLGWWFCDPDRA